MRPPIWDGLTAVVQVLIGDTCLSAVPDRLTGFIFLGHFLPDSRKNDRMVLVGTGGRLVTESLYPPAHRLRGLLRKAPNAQGDFRIHALWFPPKRRNGDWNFQKAREYIASFAWTAGNLSLTNVDLIHRAIENEVVARREC